MNRNDTSKLGTLAQQNAALPQLIYRQASAPRQAPVSGLVFGMVPTPALQEFTPAPASESASGRSGRPVAIDSLLKALSLMSLLALGACAGFTQPMTDLELRAEADRCANSTMCRTFIEDRPPVLALAVNDARLCETNARLAEDILKREGVPTRRFVVRLQPLRRSDFQTDSAQTQLLHTFVAANVNKRWYAVDNGALPFCDRVCRLDEALHGVEVISGDADPEVSVGTAILAGR
jgi:hypothetical protein